MVFTSVQPAIRTMFKRDLKCRQNAIKISHHIRVRETHNAISKVSLHPAITCCIAVWIVGVTIDFDHQSFRRTEEIDDPGTDDSLPPELVAQEPTVTQRHPQLALRLGRVAPHLRRTVEQFLTRRTTTPNPLL